uniref:Putative secreted protein n=1 Tax=Anopheles darlingi TaxID=43151 RepID=A0A2M4DGY4_ANODA
MLATILLVEEFFLLQKVNFTNTPQSQSLSNLLFGGAVDWGQHGGLGPLPGARGRRKKIRLPVVSVTKARVNRKRAWNVVAN